MKKVVIIGGVAGGATAAARLRRLDEKAEIIMFEKEEYISIANCGLPYYIGGTITDKNELTVQTPASFNARFNIDVRNFSEVLSINAKDKNVLVYNKKEDRKYTESYDSLIISTGAKPVIPSLDGIDNKKVFTLRNIPDTYKIKNYITENNLKSACIIGGGYIGIEMAENLKHLGLDVSIVEMSDQIIAPIDYDMASTVHTYIEENGINLMLNTKLLSIKDEDIGVTINLSENREIKADIVILSIGIRPDTSLAKNASIALNDRGYIITDNKMQTSIKDIYAVGDAIEVTEFVTKTKATIALAVPANKEGRVVSDVIDSENYAKEGYTGTQGSSILKIFNMTVASTGVNEKTAKRLNLNYDKVFTYSPSHATYYPGATNMTIKTIFEKQTGRILGAQIVGGEGVDKRCDVLATAIRFNGTANDLVNLELCYAPPFSSAKDPVNIVGYVIQNLLENKVKNFHWHDVAELINRKDITLLDVRTKYEFSRGHLDNFINIPLDDIRARIDELPKSKPIYLTCHIGHRGYLASRILTQNGYEVFNLNGGYRLYKTIIKD
ncbi:MAG: FAD-dependent oxidoreductase [Clostridia bacterium]